MLTRRSFLPRLAALLAPLCLLSRLPAKAAAVVRPRSRWCLGAIELGTDNGMGFVRIANEVYYIPKGYCVTVEGWAIDGDYPGNCKITTRGTITLHADKDIVLRPVTIA